MKTRIELIAELTSRYEAILTSQPIDDFDTHVAFLGQFGDLSFVLRVSRSDLVGDVMGGINGPAYFKNLLISKFADELLALMDTQQPPPPEISYGSIGIMASLSMNNETLDRFVKVECAFKDSTLISGSYDDFTLETIITAEPENERYWRVIFDMCKQHFPLVLSFAKPSEVAAAPTPQFHYVYYADHWNKKVYRHSVPIGSYVLPTVRYEEVSAQEAQRLEIACGYTLMISKGDDDGTRP